MSGQIPPPGPPGDNEGQTQDVRYSQATARIPDGVSRGVMSTGTLVMQGSHEVVVDFLMWLAPPHHLAARVILPPSLLPSALRAMDENLARYRQRYGQPPKLPTPAQGSQAPKVDDLYGLLKLPDESLGGVYANGVMITHSISDFCFDFIFNGYPRSVVVARVFLSSFHVPRFIEALRRAHQQWQEKHPTPGAPKASPVPPQAKVPPPPDPSASPSDPSAPPPDPSAPRDPGEPPTPPESDPAGDPNPQNP